MSRGMYCICHRLVFVGRLCGCEPGGRWLHSQRLRPGWIGGGEQCVSRSSEIVLFQVRERAMDIPDFDLQSNNNETV